ncbi:hypothetical protein TWF281_001051 [Arthrobotrys megalospora]
MRKLIPWLILPWLRIATATIDAGAAIQLSQANETAVNIAGNANEIGGSDVDIDGRQVSRKLTVTPTYTSFLTAVETITAPPQTITAFYDGSGESASIRSTTSTAASVMTPTGTCSMPPTVTAPCIISSDGECVKDYYDALQSCYKDGTFSTLKNIAQYVIECQNEFRDSGSYNGFKDCSQNSLESQLNETGAIRPRSLLPDGTVLMVGGDANQPLHQPGIAMMDGGSLAHH